MSYYWFLLGLVALYIKLIWRPKYIGQENIPPEGPIILCANHINAMDPFFIALGLKRKIRFLAKEELFQKPVLKFLLLKTGMIPVKRGQTDRTAIRNVLQSLNNNEMVGIFPEGTRSDGSDLKAFYDGAVYFAQKTGAPLIPAAIVGDYSWFKPMTIIYGSLIEVQKEEKTQRDDMRQINLILKSEIERLRSYKV